MIIKVCGMRDPLNIKQIAAIEAVDLIGMIFYPPSQRYVDSQQTADTIATFSPPRKVGVFVNEKAKIVAQKCAMYHLDYIQLHGNETSQYISELKKMLPENIGFIKAFSVRSKQNIDLFQDYEGLCDYFLFDTPTSLYGGSGKSFDWSILENYVGRTPFLLSGGISADSIEELANFQHPQWAGIDLNSRFETAPGLKDTDLLTDFIKRIKTIHP
ncbi:MAG: phosphoribosylanthranilate isomerase [Prolixibacteraceae bacterium]